MGKPISLEWTYNERMGAWIGRAGRKRIGCIHRIPVIPARPFALTFFQIWSWLTPGCYNFASLQEARDKCQELYNKYHDYKETTES